MRFLTFLLAVGSLINICICSRSTNGDCIKTERQALLEFKHGLVDHQNRLASWNTSSDGNCCRWAGVTCDNFTGHVLKLNLGHHPFDDPATFSINFMLSGKINPSLVALKYLNHLDLSDNNFGGAEVPEFLGSIPNLRYLNLSLAGLSGMVPYQLGNLPHLQSLDLKSNMGMLFMESSQWLSGLTSLKYIDLSGVNLKQASDLLPVINTIPFLKELHLSSCQLHQFSPPPSTVNFSSLSTLDLSFNKFGNLLIPDFVFSLKGLVFLNLQGNNVRGPIPSGLQNLTSLRHLDLSDNNFISSIPNWLYQFHLLEHLSVRNNSLQGIISDDIGNLTSIDWLDLSVNYIDGKIPSSFGKLFKLKKLYLCSNKLVQDISEIFHFFSSCVADGLEVLRLGFNQISGHLGDEIGKFKSLDTLVLADNLIRGPIPLFLGNLSSPRHLVLDSNRLNGTISEAHFVNLTELITFSVSGTQLTFKVSPYWIPPFHLERAGLGSCDLGGSFPSWLQSQKSLIFLDLSNTGIFTNISYSFQGTFPELQALSLSGNYIQGNVPNLLEVAPQFQILDLSSNSLSGQIPIISYNLHVLDFSDNSFSGSVSHILSCEVNKPKSIQALNLRNNLLSGELPDCWMNLRSLIYLNLANNRFWGKLPISFGTLTYLKSLHLRRNNFSGTLPLSLKYCRSLVTLDISENSFSGTVDKGEKNSSTYVSSWIRKGLSKLVILNLRSNKFFGIVPDSLCKLASLQILDLASNNFSGSIPKCVNELDVMVGASNPVNNYILYDIDSEWGYRYVEDATVLLKGNLVEYSRTLNLVRYIDLSDNNLSGEIPMEVTSLVALQYINLSRNSFSGRIPNSIGDMRMLEMIDFSTNKLSGEIPQSFVNLSFLSYLNLSCNNLVGKIPSSTQMQGFNVSSFMENKLCGLPLPKNCSGTVSTQGRQDEDEDKDKDKSEGIMDFWFYISLVFGFGIGFWGFIGMLIVNRRWRLLYFHFLDCILVNKCLQVFRKCF